MIVFSIFRIINDVSISNYWVPNGSQPPNASTGQTCLYDGINASITNAIPTTAGTYNIYFNPDKNPCSTASSMDNSTYSGTNFCNNGPVTIYDARVNFNLYGSNSTGVFFTFDQNKMTNNYDISVTIN